METINWGIIGCGDVTEVKSGPAFNKINNSRLVAVMRRDAGKAADYAKRHHVPKWYSEADDLINDDDVNAIYIATPPAFHEEYAIRAFNAGKPVYVEKPMALNFASACNMVKVAKEKGIKLSVAHYRREQPLFKKLKQLLEEKIVGEVRLAKIEFYRKSLSTTSLAVPKTAWRVDPAVAGGGLFYDLAPHQLDLMCYLFGKVKSASGFAINQAALYQAEDIVSGSILFKSGVIFNGLWCFNVAAESETDLCEILGSKGKISFPVFQHKEITITRGSQKEVIPFEPLPHVQQPLITKVVDYFLGKGDNPCGGEEGVQSMKLMEELTGRA